MKNVLLLTQKNKLTLSVICIFLMTGLSHAAVLQDHYKNILVGERASGMGGAFVAISDDASGTFYNPAGLTYAAYSTISGSTNTYYSKDQNYSKAIGTKDWTRKSQSLLPNFFGMVKKLNENLSFGISYVVPNVLIEHQNEIFDETNTTIISHHLEDTLTYLGPSIAYKLNKNLSIGATLYYFYRNNRLQTTQYVETKETPWTSAGNTWVSYDRHQYDAGLSPKLGIMWSPMDKLSLGATIKKDLTLKSTMNKIEVRVDGKDGEGEEAGTTGTPTHSTSSNSTKTKNPLHLSAGVAYFPSPFLLLSFDVDYYKKAYTERKNVLNLSSGLEYFFNEANAIRAGIFTNYSNVLDPTTSSTNRQKLDMLGLSLAYSMYSASSSLTLGVIVSSGKGKAQVYEGESTQLDYKQTDITFTIAASYGL